MTLFEIKYPKVLLDLTLNVIVQPKRKRNVWFYLYYCIFSIQFIKSTEGERMVYF